MLKDRKEGEDIKVPDFVGMDHSHVTAEEDKQYRALQNQLIEIEMGAKDALRMLKEELIK